VALSCGEDPISFHRRILAGAPRWIAADGAVMMEVGSGSSGLREIAGLTLPRARVEIAADLEGRPRVFVLERVEPMATAP
jgi:hypothetical protein